jgi:hypothetical protein
MPVTPGERPQQQVQKKEQQSMAPAAGGVQQERLQPFAERICRCQN